MKKLFAAVACAAALCAAGASHAAVLSFDDPGVIDIGPGDLATYTESGFTLTGPAASFLTLDASLVGGIDASATLSLMAVGGGAFSLASMDYAFYDLGLGDATGLLAVTGLLNGLQVASQTFTLGSLASTSFGASFGNLTAVSFSGTTAFTFDTLNATALAAPVPEPATLALTAIGLLGVMLRVNRRHGHGRQSAG